MAQHEGLKPDAPDPSQVLGGEMAVYIATDDDNRTALEPLIKAFPQVLQWCPACCFCSSKSSIGRKSQEDLYYC